MVSAATALLVGALSMPPVSEISLESSLDHRFTSMAATVTSTSATAPATQCTDVGSRTIIPPSRLRNKGGCWQLHFGNKMDTCDTPYAVKHKGPEAGKATFKCKTVWYPLQGNKDEPASVPLHYRGLLEYEKHPEATAWGASGSTQQTPPGTLWRLP